MSPYTVRNICVTIFLCTAVVSCVVGEAYSDRMKAQSTCFNRAGQNAAAIEACRK